MKQTKLISAEEIAAKWGVSARSVRNYCTCGRVDDAVLVGKTWFIPSNAAKPKRKTRFDKLPRSLAKVLREEMDAQMKGGLYHRLQIEFTYNSNHIEGSRLTHDQTRWIFETKTVGDVSADLPVDDIIETANHFRCIDMVIGTYGNSLNERYVKRLHFLLKSGTSDSRKAWFAVGEYKRRENEVGGMPTCRVGKVHAAMAKLLKWYKTANKTFENLVRFHAEFERIHPFQDGNGRVGRLVLLKECLKYGIMPFVVSEGLKRYYYLGLKEWREGKRERLLDTCRTAQDVFAVGLRRLGFDDLTTIAK